MVAKTLRMKNGSSVRKMARNTLSIEVRPAVLTDARPHSDCTTWWSRPNLFSVAVASVGDAALAAQDQANLGAYREEGRSRPPNGASPAGPGVGEGRGPNPAGKG